MLRTSVISMVERRLRGAGEIVFQADDEVRARLEAIGFLDNAPFKLVAIDVLVGLKNDEHPQQQWFDRKHGEWRAAIEVNIHDLLGNQGDGARRTVLKAILVVLIEVGRKYELPIGDLEEWHHGLCAATE